MHQYYETQSQLLIAQERTNQTTWLLLSQNQRHICRL